MKIETDFQELTIKLFLLSFFFTCSLPSFVGKSKIIMMLRMSLPVIAAINVYYIMILENKPLP